MGGRRRVRGWRESGSGEPFFRVIGRLGLFVEGWRFMSISDAGEAKRRWLPSQLPGRSFDEALRPPGVREALADGAGAETLLLVEVLARLRTFLASRPPKIESARVDRPSVVSGESKNPINRFDRPVSARARRRSRKTSAAVNEAEPPAPRELNGAFLPIHDDQAATDLVRLRQRTRQRARREALIFQAERPFEVDENRGRPELILEESNLLPFGFLRTGDRMGRAVVKIERGDGAAGTAFLIAPGVLLTNHHVLPDVVTAAEARARANFEAAPPLGPEGRAAVVPLNPEGLFVTNEELDFTFCGVDGLDFLGVVPPSRDSLGIAEGECVNIIQHPRGRPKEVALRDNQVVKLDQVVVRYCCDTEPGSSGSPVFNNQWMLVALHHASVVADEPKARASASLPGARYLNEGVRLSAIALWLEAAGSNDRDPGRAEQLARLRAIFRGLDPRIGYFGALGARIAGRTAAEVIVESYREEGDHLDLGFWDLRTLTGGSFDRLTDLGWALADMRLDLWCLLGLTADLARALCEHLETNFQLDYTTLPPSPDDHQAPTIMYRRGRGLTVSRLDWGEDAPLGLETLSALQVQIAPRGVEPTLIHLAPLVPQGFDEEIATLASTIRLQGDEATDWVLIGPGARLDPETTAELARIGVAPLVATDGEVTLLNGSKSRVGRIFVPANQSRSDAPSHGLVFHDHRGLPVSIQSLGDHRPIALRLSFGPSRSVCPEAPVSPLAVDGATPAPEGERPLLDDPETERALREWLAPLVAQLLAELRQNMTRDRSEADPQ